VQNRLRLYSGVVLFVFITGHLLNHIFGLVSIRAMQDATVVLLNPWRTWPGLIVLLGALLTHAGFALWAFWRRRNFKLKAWEAVQLVFGLAIPLFLAAHIAANGILPAISVYESSYISSRWPLRRR
jgi:adenylate cyclase